MDSQQLIAWGGFLVFVLIMLALDLFILHRKAHEIQMKEALIGTLVPIVLALGFTGFVFWAYGPAHFLHLGIVSPELAASPVSRFYPATGPDAAILFLTGYVVELSLSADNVFLFAVLMAYFKVPSEKQHRVLFWGVLGALVMRGALIVAGAALLARFQWIIYLFGAFLVFTGAKMLFGGSEEPDPAKGLPLRIAKRILPFHSDYDGDRFFTRINGRRLATQLFLVLVCIEFTDLVFALDSIPAIFGISRDPFIVYTSNVFAILGLRSMYFILAGVMDKLHYLRVGLAAILGFVGVKMLVPLMGDLYGRLVTGQEHHWVINKYISLGVILGVLITSVLASLAFPKRVSPVD